MKLLADHCLSMRTVQFLRIEGFLVTTLKDLKKQHLPDPNVLELAVERGEILITEDRGFGNIYEYQLYSHKGIIVVFTKTRKREALHSSLKDFLYTMTLDELNGKLILFEDNIVRIRK